MISQNQKASKSIEKLLLQSAEKETDEFRKREKFNGE